MCRPRSRFESRFRRGGSVPLELIGRIAPTRTEGINLRGIFRFPVERYVDKILPSVAAQKTTVGKAWKAKRSRDLALQRLSAGFVESDTYTQVLSAKLIQQRYLLVRSGNKRSTVRKGAWDLE